MSLLIPAIIKVINKVQDLSTNVSDKRFNKTVTVANIFIKKLPKAELMGSGITLKNNEVKDIAKTIKSLEDRGILLKITTGKITSQEGGLLNFLRTLMTASLRLIKNVLTPLAKSVLVPLGLTAAASTTDAVIQ